MRCNPFELLPNTVNVCGKDVPVNSDFRVGVSIEMEMLQAHPDIPGLLRLFYLEDIPEDIEEAAKRMIEFYAHYDDRKTDEETKPQVSTKRVYDFVQDADALTASFRSAYGIDLETDKVHWWKFKRLMFGLPVESSFMQRVQIRSTDLSKVDKSQRKHYRKLKAAYALRQHDTKHITLKERDAGMIERVRKRFEEAERIEKNQVPVLRV